MKLVFVLALLSAAGCCVESYKVLMVCGFPVKSLSILAKGLAKHLVNAGHEVTLITAFPSKTIRERYREIDISSNVDYFADIRNETSKISYVIKNKALVFNIEALQKSAVDIAKFTFLNDNVQRLLKKRSETFDVVISDYIETEIYASLAALYKCPMIWSYSMGPNWISTRLVDESTSPAYTADYLSFNIHPFGFLQRAWELYAQIRWKIIKRFRTLPLEEAAFKSIFHPLAKIHDVNLPNYSDIVYNASLVLSNDHFAFGNVPSLPQNFKLVGGYHIEHPVKPLSKNLQDLMDNAACGVIYFSMGSMWKSKDLPMSLRNELLEMFGQLNQTVIWKYEESLLDLPKNVHIIEWAPQQSILAHPNCRLFITHAGLLSSTEAIHFSVPVIGIPVHYDQFININKAESSGYAIKVKLNLDLAKNLRKAIVTMIGNLGYKQKVKELSQIYHHRPVPPGKEAVHWIEHTIITQGARHLKNPSLTVPWYQKTYLDLALVIAIFLKVITNILNELANKAFVKRVKVRVKGKEE